MKAQELAKYLPYAPEDIDYKLLTQHEYDTLVYLASKYLAIVRITKNDTEK